MEAAAPVKFLTGAAGRGGPRELHAGSGRRAKGDDQVTPVRGVRVLAAVAAVVGLLLIASALILNVDRADAAAGFVIGAVTLVVAVFLVATFTPSGGRVTGKRRICTRCGWQGSPRKWNRAGHCPRCKNETYQEA